MPFQSLIIRHSLTHNLSNRFKTSSTALGLVIEHQNLSNKLYYWDYFPCTYTDLNMKQDDAVIEAMKQNGGYATLGQLYHLVDTSSWKTQTPHASIRRIVQNNPIFFKIKPGLWALAEYRDELPPQVVTRPDEKLEV